MRALHAHGRQGRGIARGAVLVGLAALAGCTALKLPSALPPAEAPALPQPPLEVAWRHDAGAAFGASALLPTRDALVVATRAGDVRVLDEGGRQLGRIKLGNAVEGPVALVDGRYLVVALDGGSWGVVGYDLIEGRTLWRAMRRVAHPAGVVAAGPTVVAPARDGRVRGFDLLTGAERWTYIASPDTAAFVAPPLLLPGGAVAVADVQGRVAALDPATGRARWTADVGAPVYVAMAAGSDLVVVPTTRSTLVALDAATGAVRWTVEAPAARVRFSPPTVTDGAVFAGASDGLLRCLDAATGVERWAFRSDGHVSAAPLVTGGRVYAGTQDERVVALDAASGAERWTHRLNGRVRAAPVAWGRRLLVATEPQHVTAFEAATGPATAAADR